MLEFALFRVRVGVSLPFAAFFALLFACSGESGAPYVLPMLLHELGHLFAMLIVRERPRGISFFLGRIEIERGQGLRSLREDFITLAAGPAFNLLLAAASGCFAKYSEGWGLFFRSNIITALFNLLPVSGLDGGQLLERALIAKLGDVSRLGALRKRLSVAVGFVMLVLACLGLLSRKGSPSLFAVSIYVLISAFSGM